MSNNDSEIEKPLFNRRVKFKFACDVIRLKTGDFLLLDSIEDQKDRKEIQRGILFSKKLINYRPVFVKKYDLSLLSHTEEMFYFTAHRLLSIYHPNILTPFDMFKTKTIPIIHEELRLTPLVFKSILDREAYDPHYSSVYSLEEEADVVYVLEEILDCRFQDVLDQDGFSKDPVSQKKQVFWMGMQLFSALTYLHEHNLMLKDITLNNIFYDNHLIKLVVPCFYKSSNGEEKNKDCKYMGTLLFSFIKNTAALTEDELVFFKQFIESPISEISTSDVCFRWFSKLLNDYSFIPNEYLNIDLKNNYGLSAAMLETCTELNRLLSSKK